MIPTLCRVSFRRYLCAHAKILGFPAPLTQAETFLTRAFKLPSAFTIYSARFAAKIRLLSRINTKAHVALTS